MVPSFSMRVTHMEPNLARQANVRGGVGFNQPRGDPYTLRLTVFGMKRSRVTATGKA